MKPTAFFFQEDALLLPDEIPDTRMEQGVRLDLLGDFEIPPDVFRIPVLTPSVSDDQDVISCVSVPRDAPLPLHWRAVPVRQVFSLLGAVCDFDPAAMNPAAALLLRAFHIVQWRRESRFCGSCGAKNDDAADELARRCPACGRLEFPRIAPAVIVIIVNDEGKALLAHNKKFSPGVYSLIAGFNEAGESLEAMAAREIREEVNLEVRDIRYAASQPWPFPNSLMVGFSARYASGVVRPCGVEIEDARWFGKDELPLLPPAGSISRFLITRWLEGSLP